MTAMLPAMAPEIMAAEPPNVLSQMLTTPPKNSMTTATHRLAPELIPNIEGPARGLRNEVWRSSPQTDNAPPERNAVRACGNRLRIIMKLVVSSGFNLPSNDAVTSEAGLWTAPKYRLIRNINTHPKPNRAIFSFIIPSLSRLF